MYQSSVKFAKEIASAVKVPETVTFPVKSAPVRLAFSPIDAAIVVLKFGSFPSAAPSSSNVSKVVGDDPTRSATAALTMGVISELKSIALRSMLRVATT